MSTCAGLCNRQAVCVLRMHPPFPLRINNASLDSIHKNMTMTTSTSERQRDSNRLTKTRATICDWMKRRQGHCHAPVGDMKAYQKRISSNLMESSPSTSNCSVVVRTKDPRQRQPAYNWSRSINKKSTAERSVFFSICPSQNDGLQSGRWP